MIEAKEFMNIPVDSASMVVRKGLILKNKLNAVVVNKKSGTGYTVKVEMDTETLQPNSQIRCNCSCDDFQFRWAWVLDQRGALLDRSHFVLTPPNVTNPQYKLGACKHINEFIRNELTTGVKEFSPKKGAL